MDGRADGQFMGNILLFTGKRGVNGGIFVHARYRVEEFASCSYVPYSLYPEQVLDFVRHVFCACRGDRLALVLRSMTSEHCSY